MSTLFDLDWDDEYKKSWTSISLNPTLRLENIYHNPIEYDKGVYLYFEESYHSTFLAIYEKIEKIFNSKYGYLIKPWHKNFKYLPTIKQIIPLIVFCNAFKIEEEKIIDLAAIFAIAQAVPSTTIDDILDGSPKFEEIIDLSLMSINSLAAGLECITSSGKLELIPGLIKNIRLMYSLMWEERKNRYEIPANVDLALLRKYLTGKSRLISTVFFSIAIEWAFAEINKPIPSEVESAVLDLRRVRQLNDEIADIYDDINIGLVTYPILFTIHAEKNNSDFDFQELLFEKWGEKSSLEKSETEKIKKIFAKYSTFRHCCSKSFDFLYKAMEGLLTVPEFKNSFEVYLLIGLRLAFLTRFEKNKWNHAPISSLYFYKNIFR